MVGGERVVSVLPPLIDCEERTFQEGFYGSLASELPDQILDLLWKLEEAMKTLGIRGQRGFRRGTCRSLCHGGCCCRRYCLWPDEEESVDCGGE